MIIKKNYWYMAWAYMSTKHKDAHIKLMIKICFLGIMIATGSLSLVISIMTGFEQATYKKMQSIYPDIMIQTHGNEIDIAQLESLKHEPAQRVLHLCGQKQAQAFLCSCFDAANPIGITIHGIKPIEFAGVIQLEEKIITPKKANLPEIIIDKNIIIGSNLAQALDLQTGDNAFLMIPTEQDISCDMHFEPELVTIAGICKTGMQDFDATMVIIDQSWFDTLFPDHTIDYWYLKLVHKKNDIKVIDYIKKEMGLDAYSWKDLYPTLCSALKLEIYAMAFILILIVLIASMNMISLIHMMITQKKRDIAILLTLEMSQADISKIFIIISCLLGAGATICGLSVSYVIAFIFQKYPFIKLPDSIYDSEYLPIHIDPYVFGLIFILTIAIIYATSIFATKNIKKIRITDILKQG